MPFFITATTYILLLTITVFNKSSSEVCNKIILHRLY